MSWLQLKISGEFIDSHLYGDELYFFDSNGRLGAVELRSISHAYSASTSTSIGIGAALFSDNKHIARFGEEVQASVAKFADRIMTAGKSVVTVDLDDLEPRYLSYNLTSALLDVMITYGRLFAGQEDGLHLVDLSRGTSLQYRQVLRNMPCQMTSSKWGAVTASCLDEGTWSLLRDGAFDSTQSSRPYHVSGQPSARHEWSGGSLLTFDSPSSFEVRMASIRREKGKRQFAEGFNLVEEPQIEVLPELLARPSANAFISATGGALIEIVDEQLFVSPLSNWDGEIHSEAEPRSLGVVPGRIESVVEADGDMSSRPQIRCTE